MVKILLQVKMTPADNLRGVLADCEGALGKLRGSGEAALSILHGLDRMAELLPELETSGPDLRPERTRLTTLEAQLRRKAGELLRELRTSGGLAAARRAVQPDRARWWWYLDEEVRAARRRGVRRLLLCLVAVAALLTVGVLLYRRFLAPDPLTVRVHELQFDGERLADEGDYASAVARFEEAQALRPHDGEMQIWRGALYEITGQAEKAAELFESARLLFDEATDFHIARGQIYLRLQQVEKAHAAAQAVLEEDPSSPEGRFMLGAVLEVQGELGEAAAAYDQASRLAEERGQTELTALARVRMAFVLQRGMFPTPASEQ